MSAPAIDEAVAAIQSGGVVVLPTDTVYGLVASPYREEPTRRLYELKGRDQSTPTALICSDLEMLVECVPELRGRLAAPHTRSSRGATRSSSRTRPSGFPG